ncbi:hypothetical protein GGR88_001339 [Sphingomonas jejuensis]|uniref:Uncharacterized protein n=1 Tax=Sphingomonas jejuensis TaxID=904715 RepID=A0ABX0XKV3_9SPHN|nr:head-tail connector protein [Sphingomonas jejuensis]NJC33865.1 hypothetical protein [Sphingomonas jejuensis]
MADPAWADPAQQLELLKLHLRIDGEAQDDLIKLHFEAAIDELDGEGGRLNRSLLPTTREAMLSPAHEVQPLPLRPIVEIEAVEERVAGVWTEIDKEPFAIQGDHSIVQPDPVLGGRERRVRYLAGYAQLPARVMSILLLLVEEKMFGEEPNRTRSINSQISSFRLAGLA